MASGKLYEIYKTMILIAPQNNHDTYLNKGQDFLEHDLGCYTNCVYNAIISC